MSRRLQAARREVERLEWEHARATGEATSAGLERQLRDALWVVADLEHADHTATIRAARRTATVLDVVLAAVALLVMLFSLGNIHRFAVGHAVGDPIAWLLAPMVDLALIGTLSADAFLSRNETEAGGWAGALRWFSGLATLLLNVWDAVVSGAPGDVVAHTVPPLLLVLLAEAAPHYRRGAAAVVRTVAAAAHQHREQQPEDAPVRTAVPTAVLHDAHPEIADDSLYVTEADTAPAAGEPATAPADAPPAESPQAAADDQAAAAAPEVRTAPAARVRQTPGVGRTVRPVRTEDELLEQLRELRTGADAPLSQRTVLAALGIGVPRLRTLLDAHGLTLDPLPLPAPRPLHSVADVDQVDAQQLAAAR